MTFTAIARTSCLLLLSACMVSTAEAAWRAERVGGSVERADGSALADGAPVAEDAALRLNEGAALTLRRGDIRLRTRGPAQLRLYADDADGTSRLVLESGALRASAAGDTGLKINAGRLRLKLAGAEAWVESAGEDRVCALQGETAVQHAAAASTQRLRETGACRTAAPEGVLLHEWPDRATLNARLARADGGSRPLPVSFEAPPAGEAAPVQQADTKEWYVVLGAFSSPERAETLFADDGIDGQVLAAGADGPYRSVVGPFPDKAAADARRNNLRERFSGAWLLEHTP